MKILFIHTKYLHSAGGEDTTLEAEVELMVSKNHEVQTLLFDNGGMGKGITGKVKAGIGSVYNIASAKKVKVVIENFRPDVIHVHNFFFTASPSVLIQASNQGIPVVVTIHNFRLICANALLLRNNKVCELCISHSFPWYGVKYKCYHDSAIESAMVGGMAAIHKWIGTWRNKVDIFISPASFGRKKLLESSFNVPADKIHVKHNFLKDPGIGDAKTRENFYLFIGRLSSEKGFQVLLDAWSRLPHEKLVIVGDGVELESIRARYSDSANIEFLGKKPRTEVLELMKRAKALIFPSVCYEGLPLTIVEAFATGTPVIGSSLGAMEEMISQGHNGFLFEAGNPGKLSNAVLQFNQCIQQKDYSLYHNARKSYQDHYHPEKCYQQTMEIYHLAIQSRNINRKT